MCIERTTQLLTMHPVNYAALTTQQAPDAITECASQAALTFL